MNRLYKALVLLSLLLMFVACNEVPRCDDGLWNGDETDIDCGGSCAPCYTCEDGILNQGESGVDCGGPCPNTCAGESYWELRPLPGSDEIKDWHFFSPDNGIVLANHELFKSTDQGDNWEPIEFPGVILYFYWMKAVSPDLVFFLAERANQGYRIFKATNNLTEWEEIGANLPADIQGRRIYSIDARSDEDLLVAHANSFGTIYLSRTTDGGQTWTTLLNSEDYFPGNVEYLTHLRYQPDERIYAFAERHMLTSEDDGANWTVTELPAGFYVNNPTDAYRIVPVLKFLDEDRIIFNGQSGNNAINLSLDGGLSWEGQTQPEALYHLNHWFVSDFQHYPDGRQIIFTSLACDQINTGFCSVAWEGTTNGDSWTRLGITPDQEDQAFFDVSPLKTYVFEDYIFGWAGQYDLANPRLLRLKR